VVLMVAQGDVTPLGVMPRMRAFEVAGILSVGMYEYDRRIAVWSPCRTPRSCCAWATTSPAFASISPTCTPRRASSRAAALAIGGGVVIQDWTNEHVNFFRSIEITKRMLVRDPVADGGRRGIQHRVDHGHGGEGQAARHRHPAHLRLLARSILSVFVVQGSLIGMLGIAGRRAARRAHRGEPAAAGARAGEHRRLQIPGCARVFHERPAGARAASDVLRICGVAFVLACLSTVYPGWRAARLLPAESLRND
jgi:lipoprotein-releasing system permease protein